MENPTDDICFAPLRTNVKLCNSKCHAPWLANAEGDLAGYRVYQSDNRGQYIFGPSSPQLATDIPAGPEPGGIVKHTLINIPDGTWYWVVTAYDNEGLESGPSMRYLPQLQTLP